MNWSDELTHLIGHVVLRTVGDSRFVFMGYIADYDPVRHYARATLPMFAQFDPITGNLGAPVQTPWFPMKTPGRGIQVAPTIGEQCLVLMTEEGQNAGCIIGIMGGDPQPAPDPTTVQGEIVVKHIKSGTVMKFFDNGQWQVVGPQKTKVTLQPNGDWVVSTDSGTSLIVTKTGNIEALTADGKFILMPNSANASLDIGNPSVTLHINPEGTITGEGPWGTKQIYGPP